jgi:hypothetical protein
MTRTRRWLTPALVVALGTATAGWFSHLGPAHRPVASWSRSHRFSASAGTRALVAAEEGREVGLELANQRLKAATAAPTSLPSPSVPAPAVAPRLAPVPTPPTSPAPPPPVTAAPAAPAGSITSIIESAFAPLGAGAVGWALQVAACESGDDPGAVNPSSGAEGLFQFLPSTWRSSPYATSSPFDPVANAEAAAWLYRTSGPGAWVCQ